jgi:hypothetical protein
MKMNKNNKKNSNFFLYDFFLIVQKSKSLLILIVFVMIYPKLEFIVLTYIGLDSFWKKFFYLILVFFMSGPWFTLATYLLLNRLEAEIGVVWGFLYPLLSLIFVFSYEGNYFVSFTLFLLFYYKLYHSD